MKLLIATIFAFLFAAANAATDFGLVLSTKDPEAHPADACGSFSDVIQFELDLSFVNTFEDDSSNDRRKTEDGYRESWCKLRCMGFAPGTCYLVYPYCPNRRMLRSDDRSVEELPDLVEVNGPDCAKAVLAADAKLKEVAKVTNNADCKSAIEDAFDFKCIRMA